MKRKISGRTKEEALKTECSQGFLPGGINWARTNDLHDVNAETECYPVINDAK